jgi:3-deoxy-7-phosphoheptulonate synthase
MVIVMREGASQKEIDEIIALLHEVGAEAHVSQGEFRTVIGVIGDRERVMEMPVEAYPGVEKVVPIMKPYKLVSREFKEDATVIQIRDVTVGGGTFTIIAGPCSVESEEQLMQAAKAAKAGGAEMLRGGAFKPRSSPYSFQGLAEEGLKMLAAAREETGLPVVTEVLDVRDIDLVSRYADVLQVGARNMQNFLMLRELGYSDMPILLKRGMSATIEEWLMAAEYILKEGNKNVMLCERGIRTFETATRNTLDISSIPTVRGLSHLPIFVDPSHATGVRELVPPLCKAALAAGADGVMVEIHPNPREALCDGSQSLTVDGFSEMMDDLRGLASYLGRK